MKLAEALRVLQQDAPADADPFRVFLACGFTPLHLQTFFGAYLKTRGSNLNVSTSTGLYDDCLGNIRRATKAPVEAIAVVLEWSDLDSRLGLRHVGGWQPSTFPDIVSTVRNRVEAFASAIERVAERAPVALCLPTLPLPPIDFVSGWRGGGVGLEMRAQVANLAARVGRHPRVRVLNEQRLDQLSPPAERLDVRGVLSTGFPYRLTYAATLAELLALLLLPPQPKKGLITDLDDTLWSGLVGDVGTEGISWCLDRHSQMHALYQQFLTSLSEAGVLIAAASKNDAKAVDAALTRSDLIVSRDRLFPLEVHWQAKSSSVARILKAWNVAADSVVFIDDSPMELAEVKTAFPEMECLAFTPKDEATTYQLLERLRDLFGKDSIGQEDMLRLESLRHAREFHEAATEDGATSDAFLKQVCAELMLAFSKSSADPRALELVNKTNQFNLNGKRYTEASWMNYVSQPDTVVVVTSYKDKFGPLGKIGVLSGRVLGSTFVVETWVLSCRAFSRRIEHACLAVLFERFGVGEIEFKFETTPRNGPLQEFLNGMLGRDPEPAARLMRTDFEARCPALYHNVEIATDG